MSQSWEALQNMKIITNIIMNDSAPTYIIYVITDMKHFETVLLPIRLAKSKKTIPRVFQNNRNLKYW